MKSGDLCHIPQGVILREKVEYPASILTTEKPEVGIFMSENDKWAEIVVKGQRWVALKKKVYPLEESKC